MPLPITLRPIAPSDAEALHAAIHESLEQVSPWLTSLNASLTITDIRRFAAHAQLEWEEGTAYHHVITTAGDGQVLGGIGLTQINPLHQFGNIYYWVRTSAAGQGAASAAVRQLARFGFESVGVKRLEIVMAVGNLASRRAAEKAGATYEGTLRNRLMMYNVWHDAFMFSLIPADLDGAG
jgi:ribosomal-protein-serine acetyltransferase